VHAIVDTSAIHVLEQLAPGVEILQAHLGRHLVLIAESHLNDPRIVPPREMGGHGLHAQWSDDFHHILRALLTGERDGYYVDFETLGDLAYTLRHGFLYDGRYSRFRRRVHGRPALGLSGHRVLCLQNHDQVGNRVRGRRTGQLAGTGRLKIGAALLLTAPFVPMLFQGEEWGASSPFLYFTDHEDPALGRAVTEGRRREFARFGRKRSPIPRPAARSSARSSTGRSSHRSRTRGCSTGTGSSSGFAGRPRP